MIQLHGLRFKSTMINGKITINVAQHPVIRNCRVEGLLKSAHLATLRVTRQASAHESATAHTGERWR